MAEVETSSDLWKVENVYYPPAIVESTPSSSEAKVAPEEAKAARPEVALVMTTLDKPAEEARLVLALGAESKLDVVPEALEFALPFSTLEDAHKVDNKLRTLERTNFGKGSPIRMAVVGCGYAGVELAATVPERLQDGGIVQAINVDSTICPTALTCTGKLFCLLNEK
ncbi:alternative nad(p)h-ubiquinone oxidoreductase c1 [Quercus suber]|uniref:Alternative nad(P)h-ubiquinone oxidoreductase c1 n=1 Tax=Quercus suber TaxID=58331 RepID=A0AAW0M7F8_QUESU